MGFVRRVPASVAELSSSVKMLAQNKGHINSVKVNEHLSHIEVDLDWAANKLGGDAGQDFFLPIRRGKLRTAKDIVDRMMSGIAEPSESDVRELFDLIDPSGK